MLDVNVVTLFPEVIAPYLAASIPARAAVCARTIREAQFEVTPGGVTLVHTTPDATAARTATYVAA